MKHYCGIDISAKTTNVCIIDDDRRVVKECVVPTDGQALRDCLSGFESLLCVVEAAPLAEWVCKEVEAGGHEVEILCPRHAKAVTATRKKTDKNDARNLAEVCRTDWYHRVHRKSDESRAMRSYVTGRKQMCDAAQGLASSIRGIFRAHGIRLVVPEGTEFSQIVIDRLSELPPLVREAIRPMLKAWSDLNDSQKKLYRRLEKRAKKSPECELLMSIPGVGPLVAAVFLSTLDTHERFSGADKVGAYLGLVPSVYQSGQTEYYGRITKQGDRLLRWLLVEAANVLLTRTKADFALKSWGLRLAREKGSAKARVAVARKLACLLYRVWKTGESFDAAKGVA